jgi:hypothetical protein
MKNHSHRSMQIMRARIPPLPPHARAHTHTHVHNATALHLYDTALLIPVTHSSPLRSTAIRQRGVQTIQVNSCVDTACLSEYRCPTTFIGPTGMAASFNRTSWWMKGDVVSTDLRVFNNYGDTNALNQVSLKRSVRWC